MLFENNTRMNGLRFSRTCRRSSSAKRAARARRQNTVEVGGEPGGAGGSATPWRGSAPRRRPPTRARSSWCVFARPAAVRARRRRRARQSRRGRRPPSVAVARQVERLLPGHGAERQGPRAGGAEDVRRQGRHQDRREEAPVFESATMMSTRAWRRSSTPRAGRFVDRRQSPTRNTPQFFLPRGDDPHAAHREQGPGSPI